MTKYYTEEQVIEARKSYLSNDLLFAETLATFTPIELPDAPQFTEDELELLSEAFEDCFKSGYYTELRAKLQPPRTPWTAKEFLGYLAEHGMEGVEVKCKDEWLRLSQIRAECLMVSVLDCFEPHNYHEITHIRHQDPQGEWVETECTKEQP